LVNLLKYSHIQSHDSSLPAAIKSARCITKYYIPIMPRKLFREIVSLGKEKIDEKKKRRRKIKHVTSLQCKY